MSEIDFNPGNPGNSGTTTETDQERTWHQEREKSLESLSPLEIVNDPFVFMDRRGLASALARTSLYQMSRDVQGSIVECGVHRGNGLFLWLHLLSIMEPVAINKMVIGFDTFQGFPSVSNQDSQRSVIGEFADADLNRIEKWISIMDLNRANGHLPRVELVQGDACKSIPKFVEANPHLIVSLLYLDFDLYSPTLVALDTFLPLIPKGGGYCL